jgi:hypothetical protein
MARKAAENLIATDPELTHPEHVALRNQVRAFWADAASEMTGA